MLNETCDMWLRKKNRMAFVLSYSYSHHPWRTLFFLYSCAFITKTCVVNNKFPRVRNFLSRFCSIEFAFWDIMWRRISCFFLSLVPPTSLPMEHLRVSCSSLIYSPSIGRSSPEFPIRVRTHVRLHTQTERMLSRSEKRVGGSPLALPAVQ